MPDLVDLQRRDDGVAVVTLERQGQRSVPALLAELRTAPTDLTADPPGAVVVTGGERIFAAGADISEFGGPSRPARSAPAFHGALDALAAMPRLVIAAGQRLRARRWVRAGAGLRLPDRRAAGGVRAARDPARDHPRRRRHATAGPPVGPSRAKEMCLTGRQVEAEEALRIGLVDEVVEATIPMTACPGAGGRAGQGRTGRPGAASGSIDAGLSTSLGRRPRPRAGRRSWRCSTPTTVRSASPASSSTAPARPTSPAADPFRPTCCFFFFWFRRLSSGRTCGWPGWRTRR